MGNKGNSKFDWDEILKDSLELLITSHTSGAKPTKLSTLYNALEKKYKKANKPIPTRNTYRQEIHKMLEIPKNQKAVESELYRLAGLYSEMTLDMLACHLDIANAGSTPSDIWILVKLKSPLEKAYHTDHLQHMYYLSSELKKKFGEAISFISFDNDTIVIMCRDMQAKAEMINYFNSIVQDPKMSKEKADTHGKN